MRARVENDGFAIIDGIVPPNELSILLQKLNEALLRRSRAGIRHLMSNNDVAELTRDVRLMNIATEILGKEAVPFRATLFDKNSDSNWLVVWHQDTALPLRSRKEIPGWGPWSVKEGVTYAHAPTHALEQIVALRLHFDDSTNSNGPLRVLPGTHRLGVLSDDEVTQLSTEQAAIDCVASRGAVLAMRPLLIHSSSKAQNDHPRRVLHVEYSSSMSTDDGLELAVA